MKEVAGDYLFHLWNSTALTIPESVTARKGNKAIWPVLKGISIASVEIPVGAWRAPHYHTNTPELAVILSGSAKVGILVPGGDLVEFEAFDGDCVYFPQGWTHWIRNIGTVVIRTYFNYGFEQPQTIEVSNFLRLMDEKAWKGLSTLEKVYESE
ncbi:MAG: cupin domain-containing protein [Armatimonadota bacterium]